jgi:hypothetical protein
MMKNTNGPQEKWILCAGDQLPSDLALPQVGVVTNIGMVHAEMAGSIGRSPVEKRNWSNLFCQTRRTPY